jgi:hypothetical protein
MGGPPVTNIRNTSSPHWRGLLTPEQRCLVPANSFAEYAPEPNLATKKKDVVWFALNERRPLFAFAGIWGHSDWIHEVKQASGYRLARRRQGPAVHSQWLRLERLLPMIGSKSESPRLKEEHLMNN